MLKNIQSNNIGCLQSMRGMGLGLTGGEDVNDTRYQVEIESYWFTWFSAYQVSEFNKVSVNEDHCKVMPAGFNHIHSTLMATAKLVN